MNYLLKGAKMLFSNEENPVITGKKDINVNILDLEGCIVLPSFCDVHVHFREPGFSYKETVETGTTAALAGGYTCVCTMPNLNPVPDCLEALGASLSPIARETRADIVPYGAITQNREGKQLADLKAMAPFVAAFTDDGSGVQQDDMMRSAMTEAKKLGKIICAHCEDNSLLNGGYIHDGAYAKQHGHKGICAESEYGQIARDLDLVRETGCAYHVCHISTKESVDLIRKAKAEGLDVTCETAPHYLVLCENDLQEDGRFKMNPPLREAADRQALTEGLLDGTIDMIATDHAPHSMEEKNKGLAKSAMGVVGLETAFPVMYTHFVKTGILTLERLVELMSTNARKRFSLPLHEGDLTVFDCNQSYSICPEEFYSMGKSTPFAGMRVFGKCRATFFKGNLVWRDQK